MLTLKTIGLPIKKYKLLFSFLILSSVFYNCTGEDTSTSLPPILSKAVKAYYAAAFDSSLQLCLALRDTLPDYEAKRIGYHVQIIIANNQVELSAYEQASEALALADSIAKRIEINEYDTLHLDYTFTQAKLWNMLGKEREAMTLFENLRIDKFEDCLVKANIYDWLAGWYSEELDYVNSILNLEKAAAVYTKLAAKQPGLEYKISYGLAILYFHKGLPGESLQYLNRATEELKSSGAYYSAIAEWVIDYQKGMCHLNNLNYDAAINHFLEAKEKLSEFRDSTHYTFIRIHDAIGNAYCKQEKYQEAYSNYQKALSIATGDIPYIKKEKILIHNNLGVFYSDCYAFDLAKKELVHSIEGMEFYKKYFVGLEKYLITARTNLANIAYYNGQYEKAIALNHEAIALAEKTIGTKNSYIAHAFTNLGGTENELAFSLLEKGEKDKAISHFKEGEQASIRCLKSIGFDDQADNPFELLPSPLVLSYSIWNRAEAYLGLYLATSKRQYLELADRDYRLSVNFIDVIRKEFWDEFTYIGFAADNKIVYERAIWVNKEFYDKFDKDRSRLDFCFRMAEKGKSLFLLEEVHERTIKPSKIFMPEVINEELKLAKDIRQLETINVNLTLRGINTKEDKKSINKELFEKRKAYQEVLLAIKEKYPSYYNYKFNTQTINLIQAQEIAKLEDATIIEYFIGENDCFAMLVSADDFIIMPLDTNRLKEKINQFPVSLSAAWVNESTKEQKQQADSDIAALGYDLYQTLIQPVAEKISTERIIIIADDVLGYLPFEALTTKKNLGKSIHYQHDYLIKKYNISYASSVSLLEQLKKQNNTTKEERFLGVAPSYLLHSNNTLALREGFTPLIHNQTSVKNIHQIMGGDTLLGSSATKANFLSIAPDYKILHLSLHGGIDDSLNKVGYLAFHNDFASADDFMLYAHEISQLELSADMVVLSACETNLGKLALGEGIINLARAFLYAGTKSVITTLWKIDDRASKLLMQSYYKNLANEKTKDEALRAAKLDLLKSDFGAPFFWAAFKPIGDMEPINLVQ